jgi:hypothetical protein
MKLKNVVFIVTVKNENRKINEKMNERDGKTFDFN